MAYTDDWENLMNGVFGPGGKLRFDTQKTPPEKPGLPDMNTALLEQQKKLDEMLKKQNAELRTDTTQEALAQSRKMLEDMEADGLLAKGTTEVKQEHLGSFEGLAAEVKKTVLGQDAFVDGVVRAMRRPFVLGTEAPTARNVILLCGAPGTGRHFTLTETARCMAARGLLQSDKLAVMDLALYPNSVSEKLFLQDLYAALHAPGEILVFEHYESCYPGFLKTLADLAVKGSAPLSSRYLVNKEGILVDAGTALAPGAVSRITPCGKYLVFFSQKGREALADKFGAAFVSALGDVCETSAFAREALASLEAAKQEDAEGSQKFSILTELMKLRRACCAPALIDPGTSLTGAKLSAFMELVEELVRGGHKALVFSQFVGCLSEARRLLDAAGYGYQYLDGSTPDRERQAAVAAFQSGKGDLFLISLKAGGQGLNLTAADYVIHLDPWWNPAVEDQASDRAYRLGQQRPVTVYRLVARGTVEESILKLHRSKRALAADVLEGTDVPLSEAELMDLIRR